MYLPNDLIRSRIQLIQLGKSLVHCWRYFYDSIKIVQVKWALIRIEQFSHNYIILTSAQTVMFRGIQL